MAKSLRIYSSFMTVAPGFDLRGRPGQWYKDTLLSRGRNVGAWMSPVVARRPVLLLLWLVELDGLDSGGVVFGVIRHPAGVIWRRLDASTRQPSAHGDVSERHEVDLVSWTRLRGHACAELVHQLFGWLVQSNQWPLYTQESRWETWVVFVEQCSKGGFHTVFLKILLVP